MAQTPSQEGEWSPVIPFGIVPVAVANLPDGRLLTWSSQFRNTFIESGDGMTFTEIFDPFLGPDGQALGETVSNTDHDMFCPGINNLPDGRILSAGGTSSERTSIYDPDTGLWSSGQDMNIPRGYQGNVTLSDGSVFTIGGSWSEGDFVNGGKDAEIWSPITGWTLLPGLQNEVLWNSNDLLEEGRGLYRIDNHVWLWAAPNGKIFHAGPGERMHWLDVSNGGSFTDAGQRGDDTYSMKGTTVMFDVGKILKVGGARSYDSNTPAKDNSYVIDINSSTPIVTPTANSLNYSRTMHNSTVLPNGEVFVTGGLDEAIVFSDVGARLTAELYNPQSNSWRNVADMTVPRTYHSVAILMTDGRVFVGGGGLCDDTPGCNNHFNAEIYSPPYLFNNNGDLATRPIINAPSEADYNTNISITGSSGVQSFNLIRFSAATHSTNNEQRRIPVNYTGDNGLYSVSIPGRNLLPPGYYMLFAIDNNGVPSIAETIKIGNSIPLNISDSNLVLDLNFDETSGTTISDASIYGNNAVILEKDDNGNLVTPVGYSWDSGLFNGAVSFNGLEFNSNSLIDIPNSESLNTIEEKITVMAWVYRNSSGSIIPQTGKVANAGIFSHDYISTLFFGFHNTLYKWAFITENGAVDLYAGYSPMDKWVHIAATYDGEVAILYANGEEIAKKNITGRISLLKDGSLRSRFTSSGFYDDRIPSEKPAYANNSNITDEINGKIDELKVYNKALGQEEIRNVFKEGQLTGNSTIANCPEGVITAQFRIGATGAWQTGNNINVSEGSEVYIRAQTVGNEYFITTPQLDGPTFESGGDSNFLYKIDTGVHDFGNSERNNGLVDLSNEGQFVLTTPQGCATVINLNVTGICDGGDTQIITEYQVNGSWLSGEETLTLKEGDSLILSALPNIIDQSPLGISITLPNGTVVGDNYNLGNVQLNNQGSYILSSEEGCSVILDLIIVSQVCDTYNVTYQVNGASGFIEGESSVTLEDGENISLGLNSNLIDFSVSGPNGNIKPMNSQNINIQNITIADSGTYIFTTLEGCIYNFEVEVNDIGTCSDTLANDNGAIVLLPGNNVSGLDEVLGTSVNSNGSNCGIELRNLDSGEPWSRHEIPIDLSSYGIVAGDEISIKLDGNSFSGTARVEVVQDNTVNTTILSHNFSSGWSTYEGVLNVPNGITSIDLWLFSNYNEQTPATVYYDNLEVVNLSAGGNRSPNAIATSSPLNGAAPLEVSFVGSNSTDDDVITGYVWDFGDGETSNVADVTHTYSEIGTYIATLTVMDVEGLTDVISLTVNATDGSVCSDTLANDNGAIVLLPGNNVSGLDE
ncbi:galactose oxidase-like domain-containing protein, partial [uncultured Maribacter sp.]|uniref:PKD domain-containing protein n=1 Tax=uncultured Maribacter sp. TaxID=431308 RepID=UPI00262917F1